LKSKVILLLIDDGESLARKAHRLRQVAADEGPRHKIRAEEGRSYRGVAHAAKLKLPEFDKAYRQARRTAFGQAVARLQQGTSAAATTLLKTMIDPSTPASVRVRAAEAIFNHAARAIEIEDIEAQVSDLERAQAESVSGRGY
jgi:hypothetical protein